MVSDNGVISLYRIDIREEVTEAISASVAQLPTTSGRTEHGDLSPAAEPVGRWSLLLLLIYQLSIFCTTSPDDIIQHFKRFEDRSEKMKEYHMQRGYNSMGSTCFSKYTKRPTGYLWTNGNQSLCFRVPEKHERITDAWMTAYEPYKYCKREDLPERQAYGTLPEMPLAVVLTDFHYLLLFQGKPVNCQSRKPAVGEVA